jgi:hypothetical protein
MLFVAGEDEHLYGFVSHAYAAGTGVDHAGGPPRPFELYPPSPNPGAGPVRLAWSMPQRDHVRVQVYDVSGRLVRTLVDGTRDAGRYEMAWDGKDREGSRTAAGVYFARAQVGREVAVRRFVRLTLR